MEISKKRQAKRFIRSLLHWLMLSLMFASTHALAQTGGTVTYVYTDPQGTPLAETDASGNITATSEYTPYGTYAPQGTTTPGAAPKGPGYTGHVNDPETNLVYMQARYYDPATGHFLSIEPVSPRAGDAFNFNRYAYVNNNPIMGLDPTGMDDDCGGPACRVMRQISDGFSRVASGAWGDANGSPSGMMTQHAQAAATAMNSEINGGLADAAATVAPVADAVPGTSLGACAAGQGCSKSDWIFAGLAVIPEDGPEVGAARVLKPINLPAWRRISIAMEHIASGHMVGGSRVSSLKTLFPEGMSVSQVENAVRQAYRYGQRVATQGNRVVVRGESGGAKIEMWINTDTRTIETAYPTSR
jgi:RHS repeat-associated protein